MQSKSGSDSQVGQAVLSATRGSPYVRACMQQHTQHTKCLTFLQAKFACSVQYTDIQDSLVWMDRVYGWYCRQLWQIV
jgi:hypothetical protein